MNWRKMNWAWMMRGCGFILRDARLLLLRAPLEESCRAGSPVLTRLQRQASRAGGGHLQRSSSAGINAMKARAFAAHGE